MTRVRSCALVAVLALCGPWKAAEAGDVYSGRGLSGFAPFWWTDETGCLRTEMTVFAGESASHNPPGPPTPSSMAWISVSRYNSCTPEWIFGGFGVAEGLEFSGDRGLNKATLKGTIQVCQNYPVQTCLDFRIDIAWAGSGPTQHNVSTNFVHVGGTSARTRSTGELRYATGSGSITVDTENWAPLPSVEGWAWLSYSQSLQVLVDY